MSDPIYRSDISMQALHRKRYRRRATIAAVVLLFVIVAAIIIVFDAFRHQDQKSAVGPSYKQTIAGPHLYKSTYFQFSDTANWVYGPSNTKDPHAFTYLLMVGGLPVDSVTVYVNETPLQDDLATTHVLPVQINKNGNSFTLGSLSDTCGSLYKPTDLKRIKMLAVSGTNMLCVPDSPDYTAMAGQVGGDYNLVMKRSNGTTANYIILFDDLSVGLTGSPFLPFMQTFQAL